MDRYRIAALAGACFALSGCSQTLTRPPDPPLSEIEVAAVYLAVGLVWMAWVALVVAVVAPRASLRRIAVGAVLLMPAVGVVGVFGRFMVEAWRRDQILDGGPCRPIPWDERPTSMIEITCGGLEGLGAFLLIVFLVPVGLLLLVLAWLVLRGFPAGAIGRVAVLAVVIVLVFVTIFVSASLVDASPAEPPAARRAAAVSDPEFGRSVQDPAALGADGGRFAVAGVDHGVIR